MNHYTDTILNIIAVVATIDTIILIIVVIYSATLWLRGISPVLYRLGSGLAKRKIAIFANAENCASLKNLLLDSKLFNQKNIYEIGGVQDIGRCEDASVYLVFWHDWVKDIDTILDKKPDRCALVVYAPYEGGKISSEQMTKLDGHRHTAVTNFRGRLLNDIVVSMITTHYEQR